MASCGMTIAETASMGPRYAKRLVDGIPTDRFARLSSPGGHVVQANHPAFVLGHLCLYPVKVLEHLGVDSTAVKPPAGFEELFSKNATCQDDPNGSLYPPADQLMSFFDESYAAAIEAIRQAPDELLSAPNPVDTPMKTVCTTLGSLLAFYLTGHVMTHLGQLSTWRRMEGLPPA